MVCLSCTFISPSFADCLQSTYLCAPPLPLQSTYLCAGVCLSVSCSTAASLGELSATATTAPSTSLLVLLPTTSTNFTQEAGANKTLFVVYGQVGFGVGSMQETGDHSPYLWCIQQNTVCGVRIGRVWGRAR